MSPPQPFCLLPGQLRLAPGANPQVTARAEDLPQVERHMHIPLRYEGMRSMAPVAAHSCLHPSTGRHPDLRRHFFEAEGLFVATSS